jgi:uncharacterized protein (TIGR01655 family)
MMKKLLIGLVAAVVVVVGGYKIFESMYYGGSTYYTQITTDGQKFTTKDDKGNHYIDYKYTLTGYDDQGSAQKLDFNANKERPLRRNAYLKLTYNKNKGVTKWEAVTKTAVPKKALAKINH